MMRVEAELLLEDADRASRGEAGIRTHEQRAADALVELARRVQAITAPRTPSIKGQKRL
jgi:hypothetical protein